ncbi:MAG: imidazole glycerol phosphate synthase subunit HisF [Methanomassiliicoccaceae archaeon]|jgi:cyclase|nr:imidazole glycerol phosphate synthase subunit HisF [Methanomassiliicoccaceae archaeon]
MTAKKIIPCLDMKGGKVVKGVKFENVREVGDPPSLAKKYENDGADEVAFLDISATVEGRQTMLKAVAATAKVLTVPLAVGGGIRSKDDMREVLDAGASKVSINSAAVKDPDIVAECSKEFGRGRLIIAIDAKREGDKWIVYTHGGMRSSGIDAIEWAKKMEKLGAGEILLTSIDADGEKTGYDIPLTAAVADAVGIPVTASGGCGSVEHIYEVLTRTKAAAALAASIFHFNEYTVSGVKEYLRKRDVNVK